MKKLSLIGLTTFIVLAAVALSQNGSERHSKDLAIQQEARNPWTHLRINRNDDQFQFAIVTDRTGGHRAQIFSRAVKQLNLLQPEFVISVGDLIEGYTEDMKQVDKEWKELIGYVSELEMPFFYVAGNHDITNSKMEKKWREIFGRHYYYFKYKDVLFLMLNSEDPPINKGSRISRKQVKWAEQVLRENQKVRWTFVVLHKPLWHYGDLKKNRWTEIENLLQGRKYTVFAGHLHNYQKTVRHGMNYYQLATTGGASRMRGTRYGELDHLVWVTMKANGPRLANIQLDSIYPDDLKLPVTQEKGTTRKKVKVYPVSGIVTLNGKPIEDADVVFHLVDPKDSKKLLRAGIARTNADGSYRLTSYQAFDGTPAGDYRVTLTWPVPRVDQAGNPGRNRLPAKYSDPKTSGLTTRVMKEANHIDFNLQK